MISFVLWALAVLVGFEVANVIVFLARRILRRRSTR